MSEYYQCVNRIIQEITRFLKKCTFQKVILMIRLILDTQNVLFVMEISKVSIKPDYILSGEL